MKSYPVFCRDYFIHHEIRIPSLTNQDSMESKRLFFVAQLVRNGRKGVSLNLLGCPGRWKCDWINGDWINGLFHLLINGG